MQTKKINNKSENESNLPNGLSNPALRALNGAGITELHQLSNCKISEIKKLHGMGPKGIRILVEALEIINLNFKSE